MFIAKLMKIHAKKKSSTMKNRTVLKKMWYLNINTNSSTRKHFLDCYLTTEAQHLEVVLKDLISITNIWSTWKISESTHEM